MNAAKSKAILLFCGLALALFFPLVTNAQKARTSLKLGDKAFFNRDYPGAIMYYTRGLVQMPDHLRSRYRLGYSYLSVRNLKKALPILTDVNKKTDKYNPELQLLLGQAYHLNHQFDSAAIYYRRFGNYLKNDDYDAKDAVAKYLEECKVGQQLVQNPVDVKLENLGSGINSPGNDFVPVVTPDENLLVFTSRRQENIGTGRDANNEPFEDIYYAVREKGKWLDAQNIGAPVNTARHDACVAISADGKTLFIYKDINGGDIYLTRKVGDAWLPPISMGEAINSEDYEPSLSISDDGDYVFFSSNRPDGYGGLDIYVSLRQPDGTWGEALNLGPVINTPYDEDAPFIHSETNTLYYSSRGPKSMGGYDIFKSQMKELTWGEPVNLGVPINTADNDIHYTVPSNVRHAYYSTTRPDGLGKKDIYRVVYPSPEGDKPVAARKPAVTKQPKTGTEPKQQTVAISGIINNQATGKPVAAEVVFANGAGEKIKSVVSDSTTGAYFVELNKGQMVELSVKKQGFFNHSARLTLFTPQKYITHDVALKEIKVGTNVVLNNIYFELNKDEIQPEAYPQLDELYSWLKENPTLKIEIGGHTDNRGNPEKNRQLSERRAMAVYNYLINKGIEKGRIRAKGYGAAKPVASNETEQGRQQNRRTEFTVLPN